MNQIIIRNKNETFIHVDCSDDLAYELGDQFTFMVPGAQFSPKFRARLWDGKIRLFNLRSREIYRGLAPHIMRYCRENGYNCEYDDLTNEFSLAEGEKFAQALKLPVEPYDYQMTGFVHAFRDKRALLLSPTASGKSLLIYLMHRMFALTEKKGIIIVPTIALVEQLTSDFADYSVNNGYKVEQRIHKIYQGQEKDTDKPLTISTWQSLQHMPKKYFTQFDYVIGDEAHRCTASALTYILSNMTRAKYRIGTTGTLDGTKVHKLVLEGLFGPERRLITTKQLMDEGKVADLTIKCLMLKHPEVYCKAAKSFKFQDEIKYLVLSESRNNFIKNLTLSLKENTLVLFNYIEHGEILYNKIFDDRGARNVFFIYGKTDVDTREEVRKIVETERDAIIVASYGTFSTGINIRNLHNVIFASPSKSRIRNLQSIGRALRISDTKSTATLFDISDDLRWNKKENYTLKHFSERIKIYAEEHFNFKIYKIELKG